MKVLFTSVSVINPRHKELDLLYKTAKKYFLPNHEVEFVLFSDVDVSIEGVNTIKIDIELQNLHYFQFLKILSLNYANLDQYDYIFVNDDDQMYVNYVNDDDILTDNLCILSHFWAGLNTKRDVHKWSDVIEISDPDKAHTMGNFFGGPVRLIKDLLEFCNNFWEKHKNHNFNGTGFFSMYPEEILLIKFIIDGNLIEKRLSAEFNLNNIGFMTNLNVFDYSYMLNTKDKSSLEKLKNFKLIHNTKCNLIFSEEIFNMVI